jgi:sugar phosphate permease
VGGILGTFLCGFISDALPKSIPLRNVVVTCTFGMLTVFPLIALSRLTVNPPVYDSTDRVLYDGVYHMHRCSCSTDPTSETCAESNMDAGTSLYSVYIYYIWRWMQCKVYGIITDNLWKARIYMFLAGIFVNGPKTLIPIASRDLVDVKMQGGRFIYVQI